MLRQTTHMQDVRVNEDGTPNLSDMHQLLDDMEAAGMIEYKRKKEDE